MTDNERTFRAMIENGFNRGDIEAIRPMFSQAFYEHQRGIHPPNADGLFKAIEQLRQAFPDLTLTFEESIEMGERLWVRQTARGTHTGRFMNTAPSGRSIEITVFDVCRFEYGLIAEHWGVADRLTMLQQIGAIPMPS